MTTAEYVLTCPFVELTEWKQRVCVATGKRRQQHAETNHWQAKFKASNETHKDEHIRGCYGECAAAEFLNLEWPMWIGTDRQRGDLILHDARRVDVRAREGPRRTELGPLAHDVIPTFIYIFTQVELPRVILLGWCVGAEILKIGKSRDVIGDREYPCFELALTTLESVRKLQ